jgi:hypothetical protein
MKPSTVVRCAVILAASLPAVGLLGCDSGPLSSTGGADSLRVTVTFPDSEEHTWLVTYALDYLHEDDVLSERYISRPPLIGNTTFTIPAPPPGSRGDLVVRADETASATAFLIGRDGSVTEISPEDYDPRGFFWFRLDPPLHDERIPSSPNGNLVTARLKMGEAAQDPGCGDEWTVQIAGGYTRGLRFGDLVMDRTIQATLSAPFSVHFISLRMPNVISVRGTIPAGASLDVSLDDRAPDVFGCDGYGCTLSCSYYFRRDETWSAAEVR